jgi:hypothetical protein
VTGAGWAAAHPWYIDFVMLSATAFFSRFWFSPLQAAGEAIARD